MRRSARTAVGMRGAGRAMLAVVVLLGVTFATSSCTWLRQPQCGGRTMKSPPPSDEYGTPDEICTRGDVGNQGAIYRASYVSDADTQERRLGDPARFSGYTTWIDGVTLVPASRYVDGYTGAYVRVEVRIFNRDADPQSGGARDFALWRVDEGFRRADFVGAPDTLADAAELESGESLAGAVYFYAGDAHGDLFVRYDPDAGAIFASNEGTGVWQVIDNGHGLNPATA